MLIRTALALVASFTALNAQAAELSPVATAFGNTVLSIYPDGRTQKIWLHPNGDWNGLGRNNQPLAGRWTLRGDRVCMRQTHPPTLPLSYCTAFPVDAQIGVTWTSRDITGTPIRLTVLKGMAEARQPAPAGAAPAR